MSVTLRKRALLLVVLSLSILESCSREPGNSVSGSVVKIADGDTITILDAQNVQHRIRLQGIDAPERRQAFNDVSKQHLAAHVFGKTVTVIFNPLNKHDRWGRILGKVLIDGNDECLNQIREGLAWHFKRYEQEQSPTDRQLYAKAEQDARVQKRGLWQDPNPTPPWVFRHHTTGSSEDSVSEEETSSEAQNRLPVSSASTSPHSNGGDSRNPLTTRSETSKSETATTSEVNVTPSLSEARMIRGNRNSMIYHWPGCPHYNKIAAHNRVPFRTRKEAEEAGYRAARNCP